MSRVCVCCNSKILGPSNSCACGHVFIEKRSIGGRRFSEYRANLYMRLTKATKSPGKRRHPIKGARPTVIVKRLEKKQTVSIMESSKRRIHVEQESRDGKTDLREKQSNTAHLEARSRRFIAGGEVMETRASPEKISRLAHALEEINRRLLSQQLVWFSL